MDGLIRRALLGDRQAQDECTRRGIMLPCPCCGGEADTWRSGNTVFVECSACGLTMQNIRESYVLANWNTRPAPPIGRCGECKGKENSIVNAKGYLICPASGMEIYDMDFCSYFEPKEDKHNA